MWNQFPASRAIEAFERALGRCGARWRAFGLLGALAVLVSCSDGEPPGDGAAGQVGNAGAATAGSSIGGSAGSLAGGTVGGAATAGSGAGATAAAGAAGASAGGDGAGGASSAGTSSGGTLSAGTAGRDPVAGASSGGHSPSGGSSSAGTAGALTVAGRDGTGGANTSAGRGGTANGGSASGGVAGSAPVSGAPGAGGSMSATGRIYYVAPNGKSTNDGSSFASAMDFGTARSRVVGGDTILLAAGTYPIAYQASQKNTVTFSQRGTSSKPIRVLAESGRARFDFSFPEQEWVQDSYGFFVTGDYWYFKGIDITRAGYQGAYVTGSHNTFENCGFFDNRNTGLEINEGGAYTTVINCDAYRNYDPKKFGGMADGFAPKQTQGPGNRLIGCRAWENSDDGYDTFDSPETVIFENCTAFRNGVDVWNYGGFDGNGNGFKLGGNAKQANNKVTGCAAFSNRVKGFDQNNNAGGITIYNSTAYANATNFALGGALNSGQQHDLKNNVSFGAPDTIANATQQNNSWNSGFTASEADFSSLDVTLASAPRGGDGSLPVNALFRLKTSSALIDKGVNVGLPFLGAAPDLGAYEAR
jgi:hypothetical protein